MAQCNYESDCWGLKEHTPLISANWRRHSYPNIGNYIKIQIITSQIQENLALPIWGPQFSQNRLPRILCILFLCIFLIILFQLFFFLTFFRARFEPVIFAQLVKIYDAIQRIARFIILSTKPFHYSASWASYIQLFLYYFYHASIPYKFLSILRSLKKSSFWGSTTYIL